MSEPNLLSGGKVVSRLGKLIAAKMMFRPVANAAMGLFGDGFGDGLERALGLVLRTLVRTPRHVLQRISFLR